MNNKRLDPCDTCVNYVPPHGSTNASWCNVRNFMLYLSKRGAWKYIRNAGEAESHGWVGDCERYKAHDD